MTLGDAPHAFVADLTEPVLGDGDHHHLRRVLRLADGDLLTVSDGAGLWRPCRFGDPVEAVGPVERIARRDPRLTVAFAVVKGTRPEWTVQKLTEVGIDVIVPFVAERSVVRWDDRRAAANVDRLRRVAREAAMQSRRVWLPEVTDLQTFDGVAGQPGSALADRGGAPPSLRHPVVLVGPEGGWSPAERAAHLPTITLGDHVLRAETAAVAAGALLSALRAGVVTTTERGKTIARPMGRGKSHGP